MQALYLTQAGLQGFAQRLKEQEHSRATIEKYLRDVGQFACWLDGQPVTKASVAEWKAALQQQFASATVNAKLTAVDRFLICQGWEHCRVKHLRLQRRLFRAPERELTRGEYDRLVGTAVRMGKHRAALMMQTLCATGIRVSELKYITVEAAGWARPRSPSRARCAQFCCRQSSAES